MFWNFNEKRLGLDLTLPKTLKKVVNKRSLFNRIFILTKHEQLLMINTIYN